MEAYRKLDPRVRKRFLAGLIGGALLIIFVLWPAWVVRPQLHGEAETLKNQILLARGQIAQEPRLLEEKKASEALVAEVRSRLLRAEEGERFVGILAELAERNRVTLVSTEPEKKDEEGGSPLPPPFGERYRQYSYRVTVEGGFHQLASLVSEIENHPKVLRVSEISISPREEDPRSQLAELLVSGFALQEGKK